MRDQPGDFEVRWLDGEAEPKCPPNPNFPDGMDIDVARTALDSCVALLPYPSKRIGHFEVFCKRCGYRIAITTAGRPDDPRSIKIACRRP